MENTPYIFEQLPDPPMMVSVLGSLIRKQNRLAAGLRARQGEKTIDLASRARARNAAVMGRPQIPDIAAFHDPQSEFLPYGWVFIAAAAITAEATQQGIRPLELSQPAKDHLAATSRHVVNFYHCSSSQSIEASERLHLPDGTVEAMRRLQAGLEMQALDAQYLAALAVQALVAYTVDPTE